MTEERFRRATVFSNEKHRVPGYEYVVTGRGEFPVDMMRYDQAWPLDPILSSDRRRSITMRGLAEPTIARWASFGWSVGFEADTREEN